MKMLLDHQRERLRANGQYNASRRTKGETEMDFMPVVKLFTPWAGATWLLTELDPEDPDIAFGLCDLGLGFPELGNVRLSELQGLQGPLGLRVERDLHFKAVKTLGQYADDARQAERIIA